MAIETPVKVTQITPAQENPIYNKKTGLTTVEDATGRVFAFMVKKDDAEQIAAAFNYQAVEMASIQNLAGRLRQLDEAVRGTVEEQAKRIEELEKACRAAMRNKPIHNH